MSVRIPSRCGARFASALVWRRGEEIFSGCDAAKPLDKANSTEGNGKKRKEMEGVLLGMGSAGRRA
jgi:hypothetical protein